MHVAINAANLGGQGSSLVGRSVLTALPRHLQDHAISAWVGASLESLSIAGVRLHRGFSGGWRKPLFEAWLAGELRRQRVDVLLNLCDAGLPLGRTPEVVLVQQAHLAYPAREWGYRAPPRTRARMEVIVAYFAASVRRVRHFVVQTEDMRTRLCARWGVDAGRVTVIPSSVDEQVLAAAGRGASAPAGAPYLACITSAAPHKNLQVLPGMMAELARSQPELRCHVTLEASAAPRLVAEARRVGVDGRLVFTGALPRRDVVQLLGGAAVAVVPSVLESFGLPYYEAMALGTPIVAADRAFAREACGDAALYAAPGSGPDFARAVRSLLAARSDWSARALSRFEHQHVHADEIARRYADVLRRVAAY